MSCVVTVPPREGGLAPFLSAGMGMSGSDPGLGVRGQELPRGKSEDKDVRGGMSHVWSQWLDPKYPKCPALN